MPETSTGKHGAQRIFEIILQQQSGNSFLWPYFGVKSEYFLAVLIRFDKWFYPGSNSGLVKTERKH